MCGARGFQKSGLIYFKKKFTLTPQIFFPRFFRFGARKLLMQRLLILLGLVLLLAGFAWPWLSKLPFGPLPGDITIERENFSFYFPVTTGLLVSLFLSLLLWWWSRKYIRKQIEDLTYIRQLTAPHSSGYSHDK